MRQVTPSRIEGRPIEEPRGTRRGGCSCQSCFRRDEPDGEPCRFATGRNLRVLALVSEGLDYVFVSRTDHETFGECTSERSRRLPSSERVLIWRPY